MERSNDRKLNQLRDITIEPNVNMHAEGSVLVSFGNTKVICTATIDTNVPRWMKGSDEGWVTAEYGMLPRSTNERMSREAARGKQSGRTQEIQRLIGRSLRQAVDLKYIKGKTINIDCDVIQADGGTRTASITGGCVALFLALQNHHDDHRAIKRHIAAVSLGILNDEVILDLDYKEDSNAETDLNLVMTDSLEIIEIQGTAEEAPFTKDQLNQMLELGSSAITDIIEKQKSLFEISGRLSKKFLELSLNAKVLEFGDFTLKSGRKSPYFFNAARMLNGGYLYELAECYKHAINAANLKFDCIYGPAYKGIFLGSIIAMIFDKDGFKYPLSFDRKEIKDHGEGGTIIGNNPSGDVLIVDDVISAGTAAKESIKMIKSTGATPKIMVVGLDRQERGSGNLSARRELEEEFGMQVISIINLDTLITYSQSNSGYETHLERLQAYRNEWGA